MTKFRIGLRVRVSPENDNDCYDGFRDKVLIITHVATSTKDHPGYDSSLDGQALYDFKDEAGNEIPCSLYDYELVRA